MIASEEMERALASGSGIHIIAGDHRESRYHLRWETQEARGKSHKVMPSQSEGEEYGREGFKDYKALQSELDPMNLIHAHSKQQQ